ncbi:MAG: hydroxyethylthiazole kinase [Synergistaceae bacterium]|nr:hydroxyethylthiazole kinase [Synergistaceae bacterium]
MFAKIFNEVRRSCPLVHCITNYVTVNDCANVLLACGASPVMADDEREVEEIASIASSLVINIGTLNSRTIPSMFKAGRKANELGRPVILDPVGAGASVLRTATAMDLIKEIDFAVIRGNISEITAIAGGKSNTRGVDASDPGLMDGDLSADVISLIQKLRKKTGAVITVTGPKDIVAGERDMYIIKNGHPMMSKVSGTGCMLSVITGAFCATAPSDIAVAAASAAAMFGAAGELAFERLTSEGRGAATYRSYIIDEVSNMTPEKMREAVKIEIR